VGRVCRRGIGIPSGRDALSRLGFLRLCGRLSLESGSSIPSDQRADVTRRELAPFNRETIRLLSDNVGVHQRIPFVLSGQRSEANSYTRQQWQRYRCRYKGTANANAGKLTGDRDTSRHPQIHGVVDSSSKT
jgi:hypothetical protein